MYEILSDPMNLPPGFWAYATQSWLKDAPVFPISQVFGFTQFTAKTTAAISTTESTTSATLADLATVGPTLVGLSPGSYLVLWGCDASVSAGTTLGGMAITTGPTFASTIAAGAVTQATAELSIMKFAFVRLTAPTTDLRAKYQSTDGVSSASFANRTLAALKYANN